MSYKIRLYREYLNNNTGSIVVPDGAVNYNNLDIPLTGISVGDYPESIAEALTWQLENFASQSSPSNPLEGQLWYDSNAKTLKINTAVSGLPNWESAAVGAGTGPTGPRGTKGDDGASAYEVWLSQGFFGSELEFIQSLQGANGTNGTNGVNGANGTNGTNGQNGQDGNAGADGAQGEKGDTGNSSYDITVSDEEPPNNFGNNGDLWIQTNGN